jgi:hypothetical protein
MTVALFNESFILLYTSKLCLLIVFFICNLFNVAFSWLGPYNVEWKDEIWMMNFKGCGKKGSRPNVKVLFRNLIGGTEEIHVKPQ